MDVKDGLVAIASEVLGDVQKEAEALILDAQDEAKKTLQTAKAQADQVYLTIVNQAIVKAEAEGRRIASLTQVEVRNRLLSTKEEFVDKAFEEAFAKLKVFSKTEQYHEYLLTLIAQAAQRMGSKDLIIQVNGKDKKWLKESILNNLSKKLNVDLKLSSQPIDCVGGCRVQTQDSKITVDSTIDNRLKELKFTLRTQVAKILFKEAT
jgi:vacuolar-type H+-ATPase subunit E/Vma4